MTLRELVVGFQQRVFVPRSRAELAGGTLVLFVALLLARRGTTAWRASAVLLVVLPLGAWIALKLRERAVWAVPTSAIDRIAGRVDPDRAGRAIRALALVTDPAPEGTSLELAKLHVERSMAALPRDLIFDRAERLGARYGYATFVLAVAAVALASTQGFAIFEGADVLLAAHHEGIVPVVWLDELEVTARPPDYLHERERRFGARSTWALPRGTVLTFRGVPLHEGRRVSLTDGTTDAAFTDDGTGHVVARWTLGDTVHLKVVARFGDVRVSEAEPTSIVSVADELPTVTLEGAPRVVRLSDVGVGATIPLKYEATDDHGLREVHLVLRSGAREERRVLARLDGETPDNRGGQNLRASDPFIKKSHAPIEVTVEAEDNDPITGPKWGASSAITIVPPEAGEPEALRMDALRTLRDGLVDSLAARMDRVFPAAMAQRTALAEEDKKSVMADDHLLDTVADAAPAGAQVSRRMIALLRGQMRRVKEALTAELRSPGSASHGRLVAASEKLVLAADGVVRGIGQRDSRRVALALADVADELELGASQLRRPLERERGALRVLASVAVLEGGSRSLTRLGSLGRDLGEIIQMDLARVARARTQDDSVHAEIAASDLAARLREPDPSFGSKGGSGGRAGGESGGGRGSPGEGDPSDDEAQAFNQAAGELGQLSSDHADEVSQVEQVAGDQDPQDESHTATDEEKAHARAVRGATSPLPSVGAGSDSWTNKGAAAREMGEAMARALEEGKAGEAVTSGRSALDALDEAKHIAQEERWTGLFSTADPDTDRAGAIRKIEAARQKLEPEVTWAADKLSAQKKRAALGKASELAAHGEKESRLAERAGALRESGERGEGDRALPEGALEALHQAERAAAGAADALKRGDMDQGMAQQREAQRRLEAAKQALGSGEDGTGEAEGDDPNGKGDGNGKSVRGGHAEVPNGTSHKGPEEFRKRVIQGLAEGASGRQKDAIRRYADGLLR